MQPFKEVIRMSGIGPEPGTAGSAFVIRIAPKHGQLPVCQSFTENADDEEQDCQYETKIKDQKRIAGGGNKRQAEQATMIAWP